MDRERLLKRLMATFLGELEEHLRTLNSHFLALERGPCEPERSELLRDLARTAHSMKGASRSVGVRLIEGACHQLEEILGAARDGRRTLDPARFELLFATADAIEDVSRRLREQRELSGAPLAALLPRLERAAAEASAQPPSAARPAPSSPMQPASQPLPSDGSEAAGPSPPTASGDGGSVRIPSEKLDLLLARSGELRIAQLRMEQHAQALVRLHESVRSWRAQWTGAGTPLRALLDKRKNGKGAGDTARSPADRANGRGDSKPLAALPLLRSIPDHLRRVDNELDRLAATTARDGRSLARAVRQLDDEVRCVRMLPFEEACQGLARTVRDLARAGGKEVDLIVRGGDVELDRSILESLKDPLLHLVRNAIAHGVEPPDGRRAAGKPPRGCVRVAAALCGSQVEVVVSDDGRGLDSGAIRERARAKNLPLPETERELARLVLLPGFSTAPSVTDLCGRGVGLDVVKVQVESLFGTIDIASEPGRGTRVSIALPLTLTTIRALLIGAAGRIFALPSANVAAIVRVEARDLCSVGGQAMLAFRGSLVPVVGLVEILGLQPLEPARRRGRTPVVIITAGEQRVAFATDDLVGDQEVVVKSLGARIRRVNGVSGATILPTGRIALILNPSDLIESACGRSSGPTLHAELEASGAQPSKRVLIAEDSVTTRSLEKSLLESAGYEVITAVDGEQAWQLLQEKAVDLVLSDIEMPHMDGIELTEAIRRSEQLCDLPVVLLTGCESEVSRLRGIEVGANTCLIKSQFDHTDLLETIAQLL